MAEYRFVTFWHIEAPLQCVFDAISDSLGWPDWWPGVLTVIDRKAGACDGVGSVRRYRWKSRLPYHLCFDARVTRIEPMRSLDATISGDLEGCGRWSFSHEDGITSIRYDWHVRTTKWWMNLCAPVARTLFSENHHALMRQGAEGLAGFLNARLRAVFYEDLHDATDQRIHVDWIVAAAAGIGAGVIATIMQMSLWLLASWPLRHLLLRDTRMAAAIVMGPAVLSQSITLEWKVLCAASLVHITLSVMYGLCLAPFVARMRIWQALRVGALSGLALYGVNMHGFTAVYPWFEASRDWITIVTHAVFGITLAGLYKLWDRSGTTLLRCAPQ